MVMERRAFLQKSTLALATLPFASQLEAQTLDTQANDELLADLADRAITKIAFGSCNNTAKDLSYWSLIERDRPDLWIWLGDNIYADLTTLPQRKSRYDQLKYYPGYARFRAKTPIIGTWDDHDYGYNNSNASYWSKEESQKLFCDFMDIPADHPARMQDGIYQSYVFGPAGQRVHVILLDLRYNMNPHKTKKELLGEAQWLWFEDEVRNSPGDLLVIGSSLAVTSNVSGLGLEGWTAYGAERQRLYNLLSEVDMPVVMLSGDRHFAELYRIVLPSGRIIHEAMSSGLTHHSGVPLPHPGRISPLVNKNNYGSLRIDWSQGRADVTMAIHSAETYGVLTEGLVLR